MFNIILHIKISRYNLFSILSIETPYWVLLYCHSLISLYHGIKAKYVLDIY